MAINATHLTSGNSGSANPTTASITPGANRLILVSVFVYRAAGNPVAPTSVVGNGITYTLEESTAAYASTQYRGWTYRGMAASPSTGAITITHANGDAFIAWNVSEIAGVDTGGANGSTAVVQSVSGVADPGTSLSITLAAFGSADNGTFGVCARFNVGLVTQGTGFTELYDGGAANEPQTQWRTDNDTSVDWTLASDNIGGIAFEIKAAASGASTELPPLTMPPMISAGWGRR